MEKVLKKVVLPSNSAVVLTAKQFAWIISVSPITESFTQIIELSVVSKLSKKPIALVDVISSCKKETFTNEEKTFVRDVVKPKVDKLATSIMEMSFKLMLKDRMLTENGINENELFERYPNIPQWVVMFNNSSEGIEIDIPDRFVLPKIVSMSLV